MDSCRIFVMITLYKDLFLDELIKQNITIIQVLVSSHVRFSWKWMRTHQNRQQMVPNHKRQHHVRLKFEKMFK